MASLTQIATEIASVVNKQYDHAVLERLKDAIKHLRAERIRQDVERNGVSTEYTQTYSVSLINVNRDTLGCGELDLTDAVCLIKRTANKVALPISLKNPSPFLGVSDMAGRTLSYSKLNNKIYTDSLFLLRGVPSYDYINGYLYINDYDAIKVRLTSIFADPQAAMNACDSTCYDDDEEFPISEHMIASIKRQVLNDEFKIPVPEPSVEINATPTPTK